MSLIEQIQIATRNRQGRGQTAKNAGKRRYDQGNQQRDGFRAQFLDSRKARGARTRKSRTPAIARTVPATPPAMARRRLSITSWRKMRLRLAPSAARTAISRCLRRPRERTRLLTLAQAMSSRNPTAPSSASNSGLPLRVALVLKRHQRKLNARGVLRILMRQSGGDAVHFRLRHGERNTRPQLSEGRYTSRPAAPAGFPAEYSWGPKHRSFRGMKILRAKHRQLSRASGPA